VPTPVTLAQWAGESGHGQHMPPNSNNPFGIKPTAGQPYVMAMTEEVLHGEVEHIMQPFRIFGSIAEAFDARCQMLATKPRYAPAMAVRDDANAFAMALEVAGYATAPRYGSFLIAIMAGSNLYQYEVPQDPAPAADQVAEAAPAPGAKIRCFS